MTFFPYTSCSSLYRIMFAKCFVGEVLFFRKIVQLITTILFFFFFPKEENGSRFLGSYSGTSDFFPNTEPLACKIYILRGLARYDVRSLKIFWDLCLLSKYVSPPSFWL